ncbi:helix-turn-helix domain-containing protein [Herbiconiux moechotypicola]|nr:helix-turn-helix transcriptional regulator [Herbiconiux moechotypicola]MCS5732027.1 helix-turn-helix domain-containing protein [Herbiconiux moechotypicola]
MTHYAVTAEWTGRWWVLQAVDAPGAISQVRHLAHVDEIIEAIAFVTGQHESEIEVDLEPTIPGPVADELARADEARALARHHNAVAASKSRAAVQLLRSSGMSLDDIGAMLHVSKQRVSQLLKGRTEATAA